MTGEYRTKKPNKRQLEAQFGAQSSFVQYELNKEQQGVCKQWATTIDELDNFLSRVSEQDYKLTVRWDERGRCFAAWLIPVGDGHINAGRILPGRGRTPVRAVRQVLFKHFNLADGSGWDIFGSVVQDELDD